MTGRWREAYRLKKPSIARCDTVWSTPHWWWTKQWFSTKYQLPPKSKTSRISNACMCIWAWMCARTCFQWIWSVDFGGEKVTTEVDEMLWSISFRQWSGSNNYPNCFSHCITLFLYWPTEVPQETHLSSIWCRTQFMPLQFTLTQGCTETLIYVMHSGNTGK